jgi:ionotropic glutamate receptor
MYHKYKALLQNMPTRHLLTKIESSDKLTAQISRLVHVDIVNFFIAGTPDEISEVLAKSSDPNAKEGPYFSDEFAWYSMSLVSWSYSYNREHAASGLKDLLFLISYRLKACRSVRDAI